MECNSDGQEIIFSFITFFVVLEPPEGNKGKDDCIISCLSELHSILFIDFLLQIIG